MGWVGSVGEVCVATLMWRPLQYNSVSFSSSWSRRARSASTTRGASANVCITSFSRSSHSASTRWPRARSRSAASSASRASSAAAISACQSASSAVAVPLTNISETPNSTARRSRWSGSRPRMRFRISAWAPMMLPCGRCAGGAGCVGAGGAGSSVGSGGSGGAGGGGIGGVDRWRRWASRTRAACWRDDPICSMVSESGLSCESDDSRVLPWSRITVDWLAPVAAATSRCVQPCRVSRATISWRVSGFQRSGPSSPAAQAPTLL
jgi:hypothetical protein